MNTDLNSFGQDAHRVSASVGPPRETEAAFNDARNQAEEALRESEQRLVQLAEHVREVLWMADPKTQRTLYVNPAYERIWGRTCESLYQNASSYLEAVHPDDRGRFLEAIEAQTGQQVPFDIQYRVIRPDGSMRWIRDRGFPVRDAAGEVYRLVGVAEDITERRQVEEHLRRSEAYLAESERLGHIGTWALRVPTREIAFWSKEHYRIFGFDPGEGLPTLEAVLARIHPEDSAAMAARDRALREGQDVDLHYRLLFPDGSVRYVHSVGHPVVNDTGDLVEFTGMAMDVTESKLAEDALHRSLERLRALAARAEGVREEERTRLAREIHDELGQDLTGIKMDLRSLIDHPPRRGRERVSRSQSILKLVDDMIDSIRRISAELRPGILDDFGIVAAVEWAAREFAARTGTKCALELPREELAVGPEAATAFFRILQEVLTNIARHAEATEFSVRLAEDAGGVCLEVRDNGRGFHETRLAPGGSLGLLGMKERAFLLGGRFTIKSSPGEGATVNAWIPWRGRTGSGE
jgi:PAS domain S-box-containing protein